MEERPKKRRVDPLEAEKQIIDAVKEDDDKLSFRSSLYTVSTLGAAGLAVTTLFLTLTENYFVHDRRPHSTVSSGEAAVLRREVNIALQEQRQLKEILERAPIGMSAPAVQLKVDKLDMRLERIEKAIIRDPDGALAIPMLRRDIDNLKEANGQAIVAIKESVDQIYDLTKWLIGALSAGVLSLAVTNFLTRRKEG